MAATSRLIDVSEAQNAQDWGALVRGGLTAAMCKATEGLHFNDAHYGMHMHGMRGAGVLPGAYHFAWPNQSPTAEADHYIGRVRDDAEAERGFHHWLDLERNKEGTNYAGCTAAEIRAYAEAWVSRVKAAFPRQRVGCYTSADDIAHGHYPSNADALWYPAYPAGGLNYTQAEQRSMPRPSGMTPLLWQFADAPTDRSIAYLTPAALHAWAGTPLPEDDMPLTDAEIDKIALRVQAYRNHEADAASVAAGHGHIPDAWGLAVSTNAEVKAQRATINTLVGLVGKDVDTAKVIAAVQKAIADTVVHVAVDVTGPPTASSGTAIPSTN